MTIGWLQRRLLGVVGALVLAACTTPGIDYRAEIAPGNPAAAAYQNVAVGGFYGPLADWYAGEFEAMLNSAQFNDRPWFQVGLFPDQSNVSGVYDGTVDVGYPYISERYYTESQCMRREEVDGKKKCVKKIDIEYICVRYSVDVAVEARLTDKASGEPVHQASYAGSDSEEECFETGHVQYRVRRQPGEPGRGKYRVAYADYTRPGFRLGSDRIVDRVTASALRQTIWQARRDIAPYNQNVRATILTEAQSAEVQADPRFAQAVSAVRNDQPSVACSLFADLGETYAIAPAVLHNLGACAEALGDQEQAQSFYGAAADGARALGISPTDRMLTALQRISVQRADSTVLNRLVAPPEVPES